MIKVTRGLDIPIAGQPMQTYNSKNLLQSDNYAVLASDYAGLKPAMNVQVGDVVKKGDKLFHDKKDPDVSYVTPVAGSIIEINRGDKRAFISVVIARDDSIGNKKFAVKTNIKELSRETITKVLAVSGDWTAFRTRPFNVVPKLDYNPDAIFINVMDSNPLAIDTAIVVNESKSDFIRGVQLISKLTDGDVFISTPPRLNLKSDINSNTVANIHINKFWGPHPVGLTSTHISRIKPMKSKDKFMCINYQDVIAIGSLFETGEINNERSISIAGPSVVNPILYRTISGSSCQQLVADKLTAGQHRLISGSVLNGHIAEGAQQYLGKLHNQISVIPKPQAREFLHYLRLGVNDFSNTPAYLSSIMSKKQWNFNCSTNGSERAMVPIGCYENVLPFDILATQLLRAIIVEDTEKAQLLGCLELAEEDLALCSYVCPGKHDFGAMLRSTLDKIARGE